MSERPGDNLVRCEERYPKEGDHSVILVVANQAVQHQSSIQDIFRKCLDEDQRRQGDQTRLEVIDHATAEALDRLEKAGLIAPTYRSNRPLMPGAQVQEEQKPSLTASELKAIKENREGAERKLKMARVLGDAELVEEARPPLLEAAYSIMKALSISRRKEVPEDLRESLKPPFSFHWGESLQDLKGFIENENADLQPVGDALARCLILIDTQQGG